MPIFSTLSGLIRGCPRNIKRRLLRDILLILFVISGAILTIVMLQGVKTQREVSTSIIGKANLLVAAHFQSYTDPLTNILRILGKWGEAGLFNMQTPEILASQFQALMEIQQTIHSISIADTNENCFQLSHHNDEWLVDESHKSNATTSRLVDGKIEGQETVNERRYTMSTANWFQGAMLTPSSTKFFMTEPYLQKTTGDTVITASLQWKIRNSKDGNHVSGVSFTTQSLMTFLEDLQITPNGRIVLYDKEGIPLNSSGKDRLNKIVSASVEEVSLSEQLLSTVGTLLRTNRQQTTQPLSIRNGGKNWWLGFSQLHESNPDIWVAVIIPADDIFSDLHRQWIRFALLVGSIFLLAVLMTVLLVRKYSYQLKDLPQQHINTQSYETEVAALIRAGESTTLEFKSTMRTNLNSGRPGKEIEVAWLKTVVGFMNSDGGILLIGVDDSGTILGTEADNFDNEDKCRLHFKNLLNTHIGAEFTRFIHLKIAIIKDKTICIVECERVRRPVFLSIGRQEDFYIRSGPSSIKLSMSQMIKYLSER
ncbi:HTH domain-containing putative transcriptional regulator [Desulfocapsa sulfexigens DSM 10523]|uniref:HTH domain-containing putative transcriptional regulator n=1 Tax=Desulfocapsa sulfexigens (strain DSM 10523 / SB164P1) TaxID=1167006 RepID=M1PRT7_DESSD|nr:RNA-binding domain-containing protein [Desulfocapsa sulfexigens]AGF79066.1 HTH domain-containing putative transcriptional regulator [Desulfocapsa sulfexigens DSM 10523]